MIFITISTIITLFYNCRDTIHSLHASPENHSLQMFVWLQIFLWIEELSPWATVCCWNLLKWVLFPILAAAEACHHLFKLITECLLTYNLHGPARHFLWTPLFHECHVSIPRSYAIFGDLISSCKMDFTWYVRLLRLAMWRNTVTFEWARSDTLLTRHSYSLLHYELCRSWQSFPPPKYIPLSGSVDLALSQTFSCIVK